jgi:BirA family biotin operon repressor/biotin-[acetyl-CoA-carboxylase] ligase
MFLLICTMIGSNIIELDRVDSTNSYAEKLISEGQAKEGTVVWAHEQFQGKGQNDNIWDSEPGKNLTLSIILNPRFLPPDRQFLLNKVISLGVLDFVNEVLKNDLTPLPSGDDLTLRPPLLKGEGEYSASAIKWPNDIYAGEKKLGGILITHRIMGASLDTSIAGIGLNINQMLFPDSLPNPCSIKQLTGQETDLRFALKGLCTCIGKRYDSLAAGEVEAIETGYQTALLGFGEWREFMAGETRFEGRIKGVDDLGRLQIEIKNKGLKAFNHKEIEIIF